MRPALLVENRRPPVPSGSRADAQKAAKDTKTDQELGFCYDPALPKEWGPRNARKGKRGAGWEAHVTSRDPTLDAVGTRSKWSASIRVVLAIPPSWRHGQDAELYGLEDVATTTPTSLLSYVASFRARRRVLPRRPSCEGPRR